MKKKKKNSIATLESNNLSLRRVIPLTENQKEAFESFETYKQHLLLYGVAGTGKSYLALYFGLGLVQEQPEIYQKVFIVRSVVPTRDMGFLPGTTKEKAREYEAPYESICAELFNRDDAYQVLRNKNMVDFQTTSFVRGKTFKNCVVFIDEAQNMTAMELNSLITRIGEDCRVIIAGDMRQTDLNFRKEMSGMKDFMRIISHMKSFDFIEFDIDDIVRSAFVKEYILTRTYLEEKEEISTLLREE